MRLEAVVVEGDEHRTVLVPLASVLVFKTVHGKTLNQALSDGDDYVDWEPWLAWDAHTRRSGETRPFDVWCTEVDWCSIRNAPDEADPSGGEDTPTPPSSPASSSTRPARGRSSSTSTTTSKTPSGES